MIAGVETYRVTRVAAGPALRGLAARHARALVFVAAVAIPAAVNPDLRSAGNIEGFLQAVGILLVLAMGQSFVLLTAGIDLSVGAVLATGSVVLASLLQAGVPSWAAVPATLCTGLGIGLLNGAAVLLLNIPSFIVTFAVTGIASSIGLLVSGGNRIGLPPGCALPRLASGGIAGVPYQILLAAALLAAGSFALRHLRTGRYLYAVGGNREAARLSGISITRTTLFAFGLSGLFAAVAAVIYTARIVSGNPIGAGNLNLQSIAAAVIGGVSLFGGRGTLIGACFGAILYDVINDILNVYNVDPNLTEVAAGLIVLVAGATNVISDRQRRDA